MSLGAGVTLHERSGYRKLQVLNIRSSGGLGIHITRLPVKVMNSLRFSNMLVEISPHAV